MEQALHGSVRQAEADAPGGGRNDPSRGGHGPRGPNRALHATLRTFGSKDKEFEALMKKHQQNGTLNATALKGEIDTRIKQLKDQGKECPPALSEASDACRTDQQCPGSRGCVQQAQGRGRRRQQGAKPAHPVPARGAGRSFERGLEQERQQLRHLEVCRPVRWRCSRSTHPQLRGGSADGRPAPAHPGYTEANNLAMASELGKLADSRLDPVTLSAQPANPGRTAALQQLRVGGQQLRRQPPSHAGHGQHSAEVARAGLSARCFRPPAPRPRPPLQRPSMPWARRTPSPA